MNSISEKVRTIIAEALYTDAAGVTSDASLMKDLGAESIDFLDIIFRLEKEFAIKIPKGEVEKKARGGLSDADFAVGGIIQPKGLAALRLAMPEIDPAALREGLSLRDLPALFTVATFENMVAGQLGVAAQQAPAAAASLLVSQPAARL